MTQQTSFDLEDTKALLNQLTQFYRTLWQEWSKVSNQWNNLKSTWHDQQFNKFEPLFAKLSSTYEDTIKECESYMAFLTEQIEIAEKRKVTLGDFVGKLVTGVEFAQTLVSLGAGSPPIQIPHNSAQPNYSYVQEQKANKSDESLSKIAPIMEIEEQLEEFFKDYQTEKIKQRNKEKVNI